jgi:hypothetical protein
VTLKVIFGGENIALIAVDVTLFHPIIVPLSKSKNSQTKPWKCSIAQTLGHRSFFLNFYSEKTDVSIVNSFSLNFCYFMNVGKTLTSIKTSDKNFIQLTIA